MNHLLDILKFRSLNKITITLHFIQFSVPSGFINQSQNIFNMKKSLFREYEKDVILCFDEI